MSWRWLLLRCAMVALATAVGTAMLGWWAVPLVGAARGLMPGWAKWRTLETAAGAGVGWLALLVWTEVQGPAAGLSAKVGAVFGLPAAGLMGMTLLFAMLLSGSAVALIGSLRTPDNG